MGLLISKWKRKGGKMNSEPGMCFAAHEREEQGGKTRN
jgi:hypothetical protein